jgi:Ca2+-binding RTX toxin-like protein
MSTEADTPRRRALALAAAAGATLVATLALTTGQASAAYTSSIQNGTLQLTGDNAGDTLVLAPSPTSLDVSVNDTLLASFDRSTFSAVKVQAGGGNDTVRVFNAATPLDLTIDGGNGDDTLLGGNGNELLIGGSGNDFVDGNIGADTVQLGAGTDTFQWDPGDGSDSVDGGGGNDTLAFNGSNASEQIALAASGSHARLTRDIAGITMDLVGIETANVRALGGTDTVTVANLAGTDVKTAGVDLNGFDGTGDAAADKVVATGTDGADAVDVGSSGAVDVVTGLAAKLQVTGSETALDDVEVDTLGGADTATSGVDFTGSTPVTIDGGDGTDSATYSGSGGADTIGIARNGDAVATFTPSGGVFNATASVENLTIQGLGGDDTISGQNGVRAIIPRLTIDGGGGDDTIGGTDADDTLLGGSGNDHVDGNIGADTALLGSGADTFQWDPGDGSDVIEGQGGTDTFAFNGSNAGEQIDVSANGSRDRLTRNIASVTSDFAGIERLNVRALGSADTVTVNDLAGTDLKSTSVDLNGFDGTGDAAADTVVVNGTAAADAFGVGSADGNVAITGPSSQVQVVGSEASLDNVDVDTLGGADTISSGVDFTGPLPVTVDGGDDADTTTYKGTAGDDTIGVARNGAAVATFTTSGVLNDTAVENLVVQGLGGNDTIAGQNGIATLTQLTLDGGNGDDTLRGGDGNDLLLGGSGNDLVDGNIGADTAQLGTGADTFQWDPGDGSDVIEGQGGSDTLAFNGSNAGELIDAEANGSRVRLTRNIASIAMDFAGIEALAIRALGSADTVTIGDLSATDVKTANVDLAGFDGNGDSAADTVIENGGAKGEKVSVTRNGSQVQTTGLPVQTTIAGSEQTDTLQVNTLGGRDTVAVAPDVSQIITPVVDLGADQ